MIEKIKKFFKKFWWLILAPIGIFLLSNLLRKDTSEIKKNIKEKQKEIKTIDKEISKKLEKVEEIKKEVVETRENTKEIINNSLEKKEVRDNEADKFFKDF